MILDSGPQLSLYMAGMYLLCCPHRTVVGATGEGDD